MRMQTVLKKAMKTLNENNERNSTEQNPIYVQR